MNAKPSSGKVAGVTHSLPSGPVLSSERYSDAVILLPSLRAVCERLGDGKRPRKRPRNSARPARANFRQHLRRVLEQANCLLWQAVVTETFPDGPDDERFDGERGTCIRWNIRVINRAVGETPTWLPVARERGETITEAWLRSEDPGDAVRGETIVRDALLRGADRYTRAFRARMADGTVRWLQEDVRVTVLPPALDFSDHPTVPLRRWRLTGVVTDVTERKRAELEHEARTANLRKAMGQANCLLWQAHVRDPLLSERERHPGTLWDLRLINQAEMETPSWLPVLREEGQTVGAAFYHSRLIEDRRAANERSEDALRTGKPRYTQTLRHRMADGSIRWLYEDVQIEALPPLEIEGVPIRQWQLTGVVTDVTERKEAELALEAAHLELQVSRENLSCVIEHANCLLWLGEVNETFNGADAHTIPFDLERGTFSRWNLTVMNEADVLHWLPIERRADESLHEAWIRSRLPEDMVVSNRCGTDALLAGEDRYTQVFRNRMADGSIRWLQEDVHAEALPPVEPSGEGRGEPLRRWRLTGVVTDITQRKQAELETEAARAQLRQAMAQANCLLWQAHVRDPFPSERGRYDKTVWDLQILNQEERETPSWLPLSREEGHTISEALFMSRLPEDNIAVDLNSEEALTTGKPRYTQVFRNRMADGSIRWLHEDVRIEALPQLEVEGEPIRQWHLTGVVTDVTEQREAELALEAALRELEHSRENLSRVIERANCLLWQGEVHEIATPTSVRFGAGQETFLQWHISVMNEADVRHWLPVDPRPGEAFVDAWARTRHPADATESDQISRTALFQGADRYTQTFRHHMADGSLRWLQEDVRVEVLPCWSGLRRWRLTGVVTDITERKQAEFELDAARVQLRQAMGQANCLLWRARVREEIPGGVNSPEPFVQWDIHVINQAEMETPAWLPLFREEGQTVALALSRSRIPEDDHAANLHAQDALRTSKPRYTQTFRNRMADGTIRWLSEDVRIEALPPLVNGEGGECRQWQLTGVVTDVTERRQAELALEAALRELEQSRENMRRVIQRANCLLWQGEVCETTETAPWSTVPLDSERGTFIRWQLTVMNEADVLNWLPIERREGEPLNEAWVRTRHPGDAIECDKRSLTALLQGQDRYTQTFRHYLADGTVRWMQEDVRVEVLTPILDARNPGSPPLRRWRLTGVATDITQLKAAEDALWWRANRDSLTGIPNREWIHERIGSDLADIRQRSEERSSPMQGALFLFDLDGFKYVNDSLGHAAGDHVLQVIASRLKQALDCDVSRYCANPQCARLGGDEFVVWTPHIYTTIHDSPERTATEVAARIAECLLQTISQPTRLDGAASGKREILMTASIGIALLPDAGMDTETLLKNADTALYQAKESGRGKYHFHSRERSKEVATRLILETRLRQAVKEEALTLRYQPQVDTHSQRIVGVEALLRWDDEEIGSVPPSVFIPLAEEIGLIHALGEYALRTACTQVAEWRKSLHPSLRMCVNLSALQLVETGMVHIVLSALEESDLPGDALELEITETALFRSGEQGAANFLRDVRARGVRLAIDDFGTGYSSLAYLRNVPVEVLKIDRKFIADITENRQTRAIVRAVIELAHALGLTVIAEGVETEAQKAALAALDCDTIQGFLFSRALNAADVETLLEGVRGRA